MPPNGSGSTPASMSRTIDSLKTLRIFVTRSSADLSTYATIRRRSQDFSVPFLDCDVELFMRSYIGPIGEHSHGGCKAGKSPPAARIGGAGKFSACPGPPLSCTTGISPLRHPAFADTPAYA